jgi:hypothetical protein
MSDNGKYPYSCFAPKVAPKAPAQDNTLLEEIKAIVLAINAKLPAKTATKKKVVMNNDCDEEGVPFPSEEDAPF